ncbi:glutathione S-transferase C-terminal-like protein [Dacryopinax primogenitus]|uniref:glutathione transferase n=1 Tax=Dacryopinax primogenitus (strain DJM 731) TaxID=1858805 RepID=M5G6H0_DACPD|nr:glutathione S-transferase C-terminal-like protein [Dacryopinax primogenitus]EJT99362.1 glutathione S-transferase C-terminal-like protein [Dacryopinax primogenitus]
MTPRAASTSDRPPVAHHKSPQRPSPLRLFMFTLLTIVASTAFQIVRSGATINDVPHFFSREGPIADLWQMGTKASTVTLYGSRLSPSTQRVELILREKDIPYDFVSVNMREKEHKSESHFTKQPFGQVPVLVDGSLQLYGNSSSEQEHMCMELMVVLESRAIGRYLAGSYPFRGMPLYPMSNLTRMAWTEQAVSVEMSDFDPVLSGLLVEMIYKGGEPDFERVQHLKEQLRVKMEGYERILDRQKFLAGEALTLADLFHLPVGTAVLKRLNIVWYDGFPSVERWWKDISSRPSWKEIENRS